MAADDHAVLVGINRYPHLGDLKGPENDVKAIKDWLEDPAGGDVPGNNIQLITSSTFGTKGSQAKPTAEDVLNRFGVLNDHGRTAMPEPLGRRLYIFLAGHGASLPGDIFEAVLLTANAKRGEISHYVPGRMVASHFGSAAFFREIVMFMDCCRDAMPKLKLRALPWDVVQGETDEDVKYCLCFATRWSRKTRERDFNDEGSYGIFTRSLLEGLRAGFDTPSELEDFVLQRLPAVAGKKGYRPPEFNYSDQGMKLSASNAAEFPLLRIAFLASDVSVTVTVENGSFVEMGSHPMDGEAWELRLRPGLYLVRRSDHTEPTTVSLTGDLNVEI